MLSPSQSIVYTVSKHHSFKVLLWEAIVIALLLFPLNIQAQIGDYRSDFTFGVNGGYMMTSVGFAPKVNQKMLGGYTGGLSFRYTSEKYFSTICSISAEINYTQMGWSEDIITMDSEPVINKETGEPEFYDRRINYIQVPMMAHLAWGRETKGFNFFFRAGPQFGYMISESTKTNFTLDNANLADRASKITEQYGKNIENKIDYGICAGLGLEYSYPKVGHFLLEGRYYYGLGNIYGSTKRDFFGKSNHSAIEVRLSYMIDIKRHKKKQ